MKIWPFSKIHSGSNPVMIHQNGNPEVNNWMISEFIYKIIIPIVGVHPYPLSELQLMIDSVCWLEPQVIIEWGTHKGVSARIFSETAEYYDLNTKIISVDLPPNVYHAENPMNERGKLVKGRGNVELLLGDCIKISKNLSTKYKKFNVLFFLDGDHEYSSVARELHFINKSYPNASILLHDTFFQTKSSDYNIGPYKAMKEFLTINKKNYTEMSTIFGLPGMSLLINKKNSKV